MGKVLLKIIPLELVDLSYINGEGTLEDDPIRFGGPEFYK